MRPPQTQRLIDRTHHRGWLHGLATKLSRGTKASLRAAAASRQGRQRPDFATGEEIGDVGAAACAVPMMTVPEPPMTTLPWLPMLPSVATGRPLMKTLGTRLPDRAPSQADGSPWRATGRPSKKTSGEPETMGLVPWPGTGQAVGSETRAAGFPCMSDILVRA